MHFHQPRQPREWIPRRLLILIHPLPEPLDLLPIGEHVVHRAMSTRNTDARDNAVQTLEIAQYRRSRPRSTNVTGAVQTRYWTQYRYDSRIAIL